MSKHTQENWRLKESLFGALTTWSVNFGPVGTVDYCEVSGPNAEANALLIVAAPELLEALQLIAKRSRTLLHRDAQGEIEDFETEVKNLLGAIIETAEANAGKANG